MYRTIYLINTVSDSPRRARRAAKKNAVAVGWAASLPMRFGSRDTDYLDVRASPDSGLVTSMLLFFDSCLGITM